VAIGINHRGWRDRWSRRPRPRRGTAWRVSRARSDRHAVEYSRLACDGSPRWWIDLHRAESQPRSCECREDECALQESSAGDRKIRRLI